MNDFLMKHPLAWSDKPPKGCNKNDRLYQSIYMYYFSTFMEFGVNRVEWLGLPEEIEPFFLERLLFYDTKCLFLKDDITGMYAPMRFSSGGNLDVYEIPDLKFAYATPNIMEIRRKWNSVIIYDNYTGYPLACMAHLYAKSLANLWLTIEVNISNQKTTGFVAMTKESELSVTNIILDSENYVPVIAVDDALDLANMKQFLTAAPYVSDKLLSLMKAKKAECLVAMGYNVSAVEKKERLVSNEMNQDLGEISGRRKIALSMRKRACKSINKMFGLDVSVKWRGTTEEAQAFIDAEGFIPADVMVGGGNSDRDTDNTNNSGLAE